MDRQSVFELSRGLSLSAWKAVRQAYLRAGSSGWMSSLYRKVRGTTNYNRASPQLWLLGRDIRPWVRRQALVVVDHPALLGALGKSAPAWYMHGEMVVPSECVVLHAAQILVPREQVAGEFVRYGVRPERVSSTGVCVEPALLEKVHATRTLRLERLASKHPLTFATFSSGAEPRVHVATLVTAATSLSRGGHRVVAFARSGGAFERELKQIDEVRVCSYSSRAQLDDLTAREFPAIDVVLSPPHERSNWAVALGLPFALVGPDYGPFAPLNRSLLLRSGVAWEIQSERHAARLCEVVQDLRSGGHLVRMSEMGGGVSFHGFRVAARLVREALEGRRT